MLPSLVPHLYPVMGWESHDNETGLADALRDTGVPWVEGSH